MLYARIGNQDLPVYNCDISTSQDEPEQIKVTIPAALFNWRNAYLEDIAIYLNGELFISGFIYDVPALEYAKDGTLLVPLGCLGELGRLSIQMAKPQSHFQNATLTAILNNLLGITTDWELGDTSTLIDPLETTVIDLRSKETMFAQIKEAVGSFPKTFLRYGGKGVSGRHRLDVGLFGERTKSLVQGHNLTDLKLNKTPVQSYTILRGVTERSPSKKVTLGTSQLVPQVLAHPDYANYPISVYKGGYVVTDMTPGKKGIEVTKTFRAVKTRNDEVPDDIKKAELAYALWRKCIRFLQEHSPYTGISASGQLDFLPKPGQKLLVRGKVKEPVYDPFSGVTTWAETLDLDDWYRVKKVTINIENGTLTFDPISGSTLPLMDYSIELTDNDYGTTLEDQDDRIVLHELLEDYMTEDDYLSTLGIVKTVKVVMTQGPGLPGDCNSGNGQTFSIPLPTPPEGATGVLYSYSVTPGAGTTVTVTQIPTLPSTGLTVCVTTSPSSWNTSTTATLTVQFTFIV